MSALAPGTLLDGGMGTALLARGLPAGALPEAWLVERPGAIAAVHAEHAAAGARVLLTCTFNAASPRLEARVDASALPALCASAARLARGASGPGGLVAGALGPSGLAAPGLPAPSPAALAARWERPLAALAAAGVDLLWIESQWDLGEALAALRAARAAAALPAVVTFGPAEREGALVLAGGTPVEEALLAAEAEGAAATGVNCLFAGPALAALAAFAATRLRVPFAAKPSPGLPGAVLAPAAFAEALRPAFAAGLRIAGGCCGATGDHLRALGTLLGAAS